MAIEIECKVRVDAHAAVRGRLAARGATCAGAVVEVNRLFDRADGLLRAAGCGLRLRETAASAKSPLLTFKGPVLAGPYKRREEIEVTVSDPRSARALLTALGFVETLLFEKRREEWRLADCAVELDELPHLGCFVEIEGPDEAVLTAALHSLGLDPAATERRTYVALLAEYAATHGLDPRNVRFESDARTGGEAEAQ